METVRNIREAGLSRPRGSQLPAGRTSRASGGALERTGLQICRRLILKHILERKRALAGRPEVTVVRSSWAETPRTNSKLTIPRKPRRHTRRAQVRAGMSQARRPARKARGRRGPAREPDPWAQATGQRAGATAGLGSASVQLSLRKASSARAPDLARVLPVLPPPPSSRPSVLPALA